MRRWILACVLGETIGLSLASTLGALVSRAADEDAPWLLLLTLPLTGLVEGLALGAAQASALRGFVAPSRWVGATALGMTAAWTLGALLSWWEPPRASPALVLSAAALLGVMVGAAVGGLQARVLSDRRWLPVSVAAWVAALVSSALLSELVPWGPFTARVFAVEALKGAVAGLCVGVASGPMLGRVLAQTLARGSSPGEEERDEKRDETVTYAEDRS